MKERFSMVPASLLEHSGLKGREKVVIVALLSFCDRAGICFPSLSRLAKTAGLSTATVKRSLCLLESQGLLSRKRRMSPEGDFTSSLYTLEGLAHAEPTLAQDEPRVGSNCTNGLAQDELRTYSLEQSQRTGKGRENPVAFPPKKISKTFPLRAEPSQNSKTKEGGGYSDFDQRIKGHFQTLCATFPKKTSAGMKIALATFRQFFSDDPENQERNSDRLTNVLSAAASYRTECVGREPRYVKSLSNWLKELDPDVSVTVETETWVRVEEEGASA